MGTLFYKFQHFAGKLAKSPTFAKEPRRLQFEANINRLFLYTSYNRVRKDAEDPDIEEIINMASKAEITDQKRQVQENIHYQITNFCTSMDKILPESKSHEELSQKNTTVPRHSGLSLAVGRNASPNTNLVIPETKPLTFSELSKQLKDLIGYTLKLKQSQILHEQAGRGLFIDDEADVGSVIALYPSVSYSPAYYRYIPGYPRVDAQNVNLSGPSSETGSDRVWKMLSKPLEGSKLGFNSEILERRNPLALAHFANHPTTGIEPNVMVCPYDFNLTEKGMRAYILNVVFGGVEKVKMKRFGSFCLSQEAEQMMVNWNDLF